MAELGWYVYCVTSVDDRTPLDGLAGVDPQSGRPDTITHGALSALASPVRLSEFGDAALSRNLQDIGWLGRTARAHEAVITQALSSAALVPMRLCTIFTDPRHVEAMLEREQERLVGELGRLRGHAEWSVKVLADPAAVQASLEEADRAASGDDGAPTPGRAYLARKTRRRNLDEAAERVVAAAAEGVHERLRGLAAASTVLPPQRPELSGRAGRMILNGAYLVPKEREPGFAAEARGLHDAHRAQGFELQVSGPWAPYNFVTHGEPAR